MKTLYFFTGAGLSAPSGILTFRGIDGLWENHSIYEICDIRSWKKNFDIVHKFYNERRTSLKNVYPNTAHNLIAKWQNSYSNCKVLTQNVDDLLERAGSVPIHVHGKISEMKCVACGNTWDIGYSSWNFIDDGCPKCKSIRGVKPGIIMFHENAPKYVHYTRMCRNASAGDVIVVIGTSGQVLQISEDLRYTNATKILNNLEPSDFIDETVFQHVLYESADIAAPKIDALLQKYLNS